MNRGAGGLADMFFMGESTLGLGWNTDKSGELASLRLAHQTVPSTTSDGLRRLYTTPNHQQHPTRARCLYLGQSSENIQALKQMLLHRSGESDHVAHADG
jgi:hypothetical protein